MEHKWDNRSRCDAVETLDEHHFHIVLCLRFLGIHHVIWEELKMAKVNSHEMILKECLSHARAEPSFINSTFQWLFTGMISGTKLSLSCALGFWDYSLKNNYEKGQDRNKEIERIQIYLMNVNILYLANLIFLCTFSN